MLSIYLGVEVEQNENSIKMHQTQYCEQVLKKFGFSEAHPSRIPMETTLRLTVEDTDTAPRTQEPKNGKKFPYRAPVSCASRRQTIVAQSTTEAEYVAAWEACMEAQGLRNVMIEVFPKLVTKLDQGIDNEAAFVMATNPTYSRRTRHIELRWHYVRDQVVNNTVELWKVKTDDNPSDLMTKSLASDRFEMLNNMLGITKDHIPKNETSEGVVFDSAHEDFE
ncbi:Retrotransposon protein [Phytophthora megakarya]|uniref:Retrotransposon protein n=1 Tax=Phytophthora megakarya TaxID=4795 RepID=A0A225VTT8_9STRA|nr:Retrotransposon protein [Phytophthora megakarya]